MNDKRPIVVLSERNKRQFGFLALFAGWFAVVLGSFGVWMQGRGMYDGNSLVNIADVLCPQDIYLSICLPSLVLSVGGLLVSWVILASNLTEHFSAKKRNVLFALFAVILMVAIMVPSKIATEQDWARATVAANEHFKNMQTNASATTLEKSRQVR
jgi:hypothetical protein